MPTLPCRNIELKARLADLGAARAIAKRLATAHLGTMTQVDTYFRCTHGRLKLREIDESMSQLVSYCRADEATAKASDYRVVEVTGCDGLKQALAEALGVWKVVRKRREVFLYENLRIHLDEVEGLGTFLEFEAVLSADRDEVAGRAQIAQLSRRFGISQGDLVRASYSDLL
jgi:adenylate cyclase class 2